MIFNPFASIYNKHQELRPSLSKKIRDTFFVFWGNPLGIDAQPQWGLFDYFTLGIFVLNLHVLKAISENKNTVLKLILSPITLLSIIAYLMVDLLPRFLVASTLTIISIPLVVLVHVVSNELKRWDVKKEVDALIQECVNESSNSLTIEEIPINLNDWTKIRTNYLIEQLNHNSAITKLTINYDNADTKLLVEFGLKLIHITNLSISNMGAKIISPKFYLKPSEDIKDRAGKLKVILVDPNQNLFTFLMENTKIDELKVHDVAISNRSIDEFNEQINQKQIKHLCKLSTTISPHKNMSGQINADLQASVLLKSCIEFYKIMITPWSTVRNHSFEPINKDIIELILMALLRGCSKDILKQSCKFGFFSQQPAVIGLDSQLEEALIDLGTEQEEKLLNNMNNGI